MSSRSTMSKVKIAGGVIVALLGLIAILTTVIGPHSVRSWVASRYSRVSTEGASAVYSAPSAPTRVADAITSDWAPASRLNAPDGVYLRYSDDVVAVVPATGGGSRIYIDPASRGYARWYGAVGGWWGTYGGPGQQFRGGGPGAGK